MILLSYNCRGVTSQAKKLALRDLVLSLKADVVMLQENLGDGDVVVECLTKLFPRWNFHALDANGRSGGVATGYDT